mmetsp:Transcript_28547/g.62455  ORF Transcript_28547/g.62455 Transcript_28547/m.62455 type:complete len:375 (-) Transcript_28547:235-1359(-)
MARCCEAPTLIPWQLWLEQHSLPSTTACIELGVFNLLAGSPRKTSDLASELSLCEVALEAVLQLMRTKKVVTLDDARWNILEAGRQFLVESSSFFAGPYLCTCAANKEAHDRLVARLRRAHFSTATLDQWRRGDLRGDLHRAEACIVHMHALHSPNAISAVPTLMRVLETRCATETASAGLSECPLALLDAGGGSGVYSVCMAKSAPLMRCDIGEIPEVVVAINGLGYIPPDVRTRVRPIQLNLFADDWPQGYDAVLLSSVLHDWSEEEAVAILQRACRALKPGGVVLVHEMPLADSDDCSEQAQLAAALSVHMALYTAEGAQRTVERMHEILCEASFQDVLTLPTASGFSVTSAIKARQHSKADSPGGPLQSV